MLIDVVHRGLHDAQKGFRGALFGCTCPTRSLRRPQDLFLSLLGGGANGNVVEQEKAIRGVGA